MDAENGGTFLGTTWFVIKKARFNMSACYYVEIITLDVITVE